VLSGVFMLTESLKYSLRYMLSWVFMGVERVFRERVRELEEYRAKLKNPEVFDLKVVPSRIYERKELSVIVERMAEYKVLKIPQNIIVFGFRGCGKTVSILHLLRILKNEGRLKTFYVKARDCPSTYSIYQKMTGISGVGYHMSMLMEKSLSIYREDSVIVVDDADFLEDFNFLYTFTRESNASIILLAQNIQIINKIDESTYSSMQPLKLYFAEYTPEELYQILRMRAEDGLYRWDDRALRLLSAIVVRDYRSDARIAIKSLMRLAVSDKWDEENVRRTVEEASREIESLTLRELRDRDLLTLYIVSKVKETSKAYPIFNTYIAKYEGRFLTKPIFFRILNYLQNLGLITQVKKRVGRSFTIEVDPLIDEKTLEREVQERFGKIEVKIERNEVTR